jgi:multidrug resistance efflux pump
MAKRLIPLAIIALALFGVLVWSQQRHAPPKVSGVIEADEIRLGSRVGGRVKEVLVEEGQRVTPGKPLVVLEEFDLKERLAEAVAIRNERQSQYDKLQTGLRPEEVAQAEAAFKAAVARVDRAERPPRDEEVAAARAQVKLAAAQLELAQQNQERLVDLAKVQRGTVTQADLDRAAQDTKVALARLEVTDQDLAILLLGAREEERREARAQRDEAEAAWELAKAGFRKEDVEQAKAALNAASAAVDAINKQIGELTITSSVAGIVEALELQPGDLVSAGAPVLSIMDTDHLWVRAYVPQGNLDLQHGQKLRVTVDAYPNRDFNGTITFIARQAEFTPSNVQTYDERAKQMFRIKVTLEKVADKEVDLRPGMTVDVWLNEEPK